MNKLTNQALIDDAIMQSARRVFELESKAIQNLAKYLDQSFITATKAILSCKGKLVFTGIGKAGVIAQKVASTFSSLGRASFFMHSAEAAHGDLGMIRKSDLVFLFSNSGASKEVTAIVPSIKKMGCQTIAVCGKKDSYLYREVDYPLFIGELEEACGLGLAPTTSTTAMLVIGDALAVAVLNQDKNFDEQNFAFYHPGGSLGKKLMYVKALMRKDTEIVKVGKDNKVKEVILRMTEVRIGTAVVVNGEEVVGVFSDGDLRRGLTDSNFLDRMISEVMTTNPTFCREDEYVMNAINLMKEKKIGEIPVLNAEGLAGVICLKDLV